MRRNRVPIHWQRIQEEVEPHQEAADRPPGVAEEEVVPHAEPVNRPAEGAAQLQPVHEEQTVHVETEEVALIETKSLCTNDTVEQHHQEKENEFIDMVNRPLPSATYTSGREIFSFLDEDVDLSFLSYERCAKTPDINVAPKSTNSVPTASPLRKMFLILYIVNFRFVN